MNGIEIVGNGNIGEKARQLLEKMSSLAKIGFSAPRRTVLAEGYFDGFFQRNGLGANLRSVEISEDLEAKIKNGSLTSEELEVLKTVILSYRKKPLVIRSSGEGDARGTGIYNSEFTVNSLEWVTESLQSVLASYFSTAATTFRMDANREEGFAVIVEPMIGQKIRSFFAPLLSGFGYTSTSRGEGYINIVPFLCGGVDSSYGERLTENILKGFNGSLARYRDSAREDARVTLKTRLTRESGLLGTCNPDFSSMNSCYGKVFVRGSADTRGKVLNETSRLEGEIKRVFDEVDLLPLFEMMKRMEDAFGRPQYFEWAMTTSKGKPKYWMLQIADVDKKLDVLDFGDLGEVLFSGHSVTGSGIKECDKIAYCIDYWQIESLRKFNQRNNDYVLLYSGKLTKGAPVAEMNYEHYSNASVFIESPDSFHDEEPIDHLRGQMDLTGKLFAILDRGSVRMQQWRKFKTRLINENELQVYRGKVRIIGSEMQNRLVVSVID